MCEPVHMTYTIHARQAVPRGSARGLRGRCRIHRSYGASAPICSYGAPPPGGSIMRTRLGHYDIVAELGRGGMGVVYKGYESSLNRYVAIKVLADSLAHDEGIKERFLREARSMAALNDPHIIQIYFIGEDEGQTFFVME